MPWNFARNNNETIKNLWMQCYTQEEIAKSTGLDQATISRKTKDFMQDVENYKLHKDFTPQLYNIWNFARNNNHLLS